MKRQKQVHLLLTEDEKSAMEREAGRLGMTLSAWVRWVVRPRLGFAVAGDDCAG